MLAIHEVQGAAEHSQAGIDPDLLSPAAKNGRRRLRERQLCSAPLAEPDGADGLPLISTERPLVQQPGPGRYDSFVREVLESSAE